MEEKLARISDLLQTQQALISAHLEAFEPARPPAVSPPVWVSPEQYLPEFERQRLANLSRFDRAGRQRARADAASEAERAARDYNAWLDGEHRSAIAEADRWWQALTRNDADTVLDVVNAAFVDHASVGAALSIDNDGLSAVMIQPPAEAFGDQKAAITPGGKPTIKRMTKTEQRQQWTACTLSRAVATILEAFAVAPGLATVRLAVVTEGGIAGGGPGRHRLVLAGEITRAAAANPWPTRLSLAAFQDRGQFAAQLDRFGALTELAVDHDAGLRELIEGLNGVIEVEADNAASPRKSKLPDEREPEGAPMPTTTDIVAQRQPRHEADRSSSPRPAVQPDGVMPDGRPFELWGRRAAYCNQRIAGTEHRQDAVLAALPSTKRNNIGSNGVEHETEAVLVPEPSNPHDRNAVACYIGGRLVGYLPRDDAARYQAALAKLVAGGRLPTAPARIWVRLFDEWDDWDDERPARPRKKYWTDISVRLAEPHMIAPINVPPPRPRVELPGHAHAKVTGTQDHLDALRALLGDRETGWAHVVLEPHEISTARTTKTVVAVRANGRMIGTLSPQTSAQFLPVVEPLVEAGCHVVVRAVVTGSPVSATANIYAARSHDLPRTWFDQVAADTGIDLR